MLRRIEHLGLALALGIPFFIVMTKMDMTPAPVITAHLKAMQRLLKSAGVRRQPLIVRGVSEVFLCAERCVSER